MSLSKTIIYGTLADVKKMLAQGAVLDEVDEYGYTPLVQTAIMDDLEKARAVLEAGADVNFTDLTGRSALHWATDNNNMALCQLLLKNGANANAYTTAGQAVLVMPLLRQNKKLIELLQQYGADLDFAQDFINAKLIGHRFELKGRVDIVDPKNTFIEIAYEGFYLEFTISVVLNSLTQFKNNYYMRKLRHQAPMLVKIIECFQVAAELIKLQHYRIKPEHHAEKINALLKHDILIIPIACQGHAIVMVRHGDYLIRCDRGEYGRKHGTVILYKMGKPQALTNAMITHLIYKHTTRADINEALPKELQLEKIAVLPLSEQITGNCSWANVEAAMPAILLFLSKENHEKTALDFYHEWEAWDQNRALHFCIERFQTTPSRARQASMASMLVAILFQRCDHNNVDDMRRARRILPLIAKSEFNYILQNYYDVYAKNKKTPEGNNFTQLLDDFGVRLAH